MLLTLCVPLALDAQEVERVDTAGAHDREMRHRAPVTSIVLTRAELAEIPAQTLDDVLRSVATVNLPPQGSLLADPANSTVSMRGLAGNGVLVLVDGVPINDAYFGTVQWRAVPVEQIERVEIVHGAATARYAAQAVAGVILVTTRRPTTNQFELQGALGTFLSANGNPYRVDRGPKTTGRANLLASRGLPGGARLTVHANFTGSKGTWLELRGDDNFTQLSATSGSARVDFAPGRTTGHVEVGLGAILPHTVDAPTDQFPPLVYSRADTRAKTASGALTRRDVAGGVLDGVAFFADTRRDRLAEPIFEPQERTTTRDGGARLTWTRPLTLHGRSACVVLGGDGRVIAASSDARGFLDTGDDAVRAASGSLRTAGLFAEGEWEATERLKVRSGLRVGRVAPSSWRYAMLLGSDGTVAAHATTQLNPTINVSYALLPSWIVRASAYAGANPPTPFILSPFGTSLRAPLSGTALVPVDLRPERVTGGEIGVDVAVGALSLVANVFEQRLRDGIVDVETSYSSFNFGLVNGQRRRSRGTEVAAEWSRGPSLAIRASHTYLSAIVTASPSSARDVEYGSPIGRRDENAPIHTLAGSVRGRLPWGVRGMVRGRYQSRAMRVPLIGFGQPAPLAVFDAALFIPLARDVELSIRGENVLNRRYAGPRLFAPRQEGLPSLLTVGARLLVPR